MRKESGSGFPKINQDKVKRVLRLRGICYNCGFDRLQPDWLHCTRCRCEVAAISQSDKRPDSKYLTSRPCYEDLPEWIKSEGRRLYKLIKEKGYLDD